jgi:hypothetical protein
VRRERVALVGKLRERHRPATQQRPVPPLGVAPDHAADIHEDVGHDRHAVLLEVRLCGFGEWMVRGLHHDLAPRTLEKLLYRQHVRVLAPALLELRVQREHGRPRRRHEQLRADAALDEPDPAQSRAECGSVCSGERGDAAVSRFGH